MCAAFQQFHWLVVAVIAFFHVNQAQIQNQGINSFGGQPSAQNIQTGQRIQPPAQFNGQQRWIPPINNAGTNRQPQNNGFLRGPSGTLGSDSNRPYNGGIQQGPPRTDNNAINRPFNIRPRPLETAGNTYNRPLYNYDRFQRKPQLSPASEQNRQITNGPQRPPIAINNAPYNGQPQGAVSDYGRNRPYVMESQRPSLANDNFQNKPVYYNGPRRDFGPNESNTPIYIRRAQRPPPPTNNALNQPIYNVERPIRLVDNESNRPINLSGFQPESVTSSDVELSKKTNLEDLPTPNGESKVIRKNTAEETSPTVSNQLKPSTSSIESKLSSSEITKESNPSTGIRSTLSLLEKSDKTTESENVNSTSKKSLNKLEATTSSIQHLPSVNTSTTDNAE